MSERRYPEQAFDIPLSDEKRRRLSLTCPVYRRLRDEMDLYQGYYGVIDTIDHVMDKIQSDPDMYAACLILAKLKTVAEESGA